MPVLPPIYFERLLEDSPDIIIAVDREGEIIFYNDGARATLGYMQEEVLGKHVSCIYATLADAKAVMSAMRDSLDGPGKVRNFQTAFIAKGGERIGVAISGVLIHDEAGLENGSIGFAKDLRKIQRRDQLATLGEIAVSLAHEINNPITAILNNLRLVTADVHALAGDRDSEIESERLDSIGASVGKIKMIVDRLIEMAGTGEYDTREYMPGTRMADLTRKSGSAGPPPALATPTTPGASPMGSSLKGLLVLVVDDDLAVCHSVVDLLRANGCEVESASSGREAEAMLAKKAYDLVLSDVVMPDVDGYELFLKVKQRYPNTPVVLMTAFFYDRDHVLKRSKLAGLENVLFKKPIDPGRLVEIVRERGKR